MNGSNILPGIDHVMGAHGKNEIFICCPYCEKRGKGVDTKYHLGVNTVKGVYHCFKCDAAGRMSDIKELALLAPSDISLDLDAVKQKLRGMFESESKEFDLDKISWPLTGDTPMAYKYMLDRGFSPEEIIKHKLRVGRPYTNGIEEVNKFSGRIIFPFISDGKCVYFTARSINGREPKYLNSSGSKSTLVYNIDSVNGTCILCEGIVSAIAAERTTGIPAVSILGKSASFFQLNRIRSKCNKIYLSFDGDVTEDETFAILKKLLKMFDEVYHIKLPHGMDPDELKEDYRPYFSNAKKVPILI